MLAYLAMAAIAIVADRPAAAESISGKYTRKDEMNAARVGGRVMTLRDLIDRRAQAPRRFDSFNPRLGRALSLGLDGLNARRAIAPARFDFFHPCLAYLLGDTVGAGLPGPIGGLGQPDLLPDVIVPPAAEAPPPVGSPVPDNPGISPTGQPTVPPQVPPVTPPNLPQVPTPPGQSPSPPGPDVPIGPGGQPGPDLPPPGEVPPGPGGQPVTPTQTQTPAEVIPEPPGLLLLGLGLAGLVGALSWRRRSRGPRPAPSPAA